MNITDNTEAFDSIEEIENNTDFDILNWSEFSMDVINRYGDDDETETLNVYGKSTKEIIEMINKI